MSNALTIIRSLVIYGLCLPLAIFLGYLLAMPMDMVSMTIVVITVMLPLLPILLKWHHLLLFTCWNTSMVLFFLPGRPSVWMTMVAASMLLSILQHVLNRNIRFISVPSITRPLIFLALVIVVTAKLTGGFGMRAMGGDAYGGKRYFLLLAAIIGYFAMAAYRVPEGKAPTYVAVYLLGTLTAIVGNLAPFVDSSFYFLFALFPVESTLFMSGGSGQDLSMRMGGLTFAATAMVGFVLARHGVRDLFSLGERWSFMPFRLRGGFGLNHPWRLILFLVAVWTALAGGYRSTAIALMLLFFFQFHYEGLFRSQLLPALVLVGILAAAIALPLANKLPFAIQRSLSFLPLELDSTARLGAEATSEWRLKMWRAVMPMVPQYLLLGKGYAINPNELISARDDAARTGVDNAESAIVAGDYHNGPLSVIIPLGIGGAVAFLWLLGAGFQLLRNNLRYGDPALRQINIFLLSYFLARVIGFFAVFGSFHGELMLFTGLLGLSVSINGGMCRPPVLAPAEKPAFSQFKLARANR